MCLLSRNSFVAGLLSDLALFSFAQLKIEFSFSPVLPLPSEVLAGLWL